VAFTQIKSLLEKSLKVSSIAILDNQIKVPLRFVACILTNNIWMKAQLSEAHSFLVEVFKHPLIHFTSSEEFASVDFSLFRCIFVGVLIC
jgi:hypothetical protein